MLKLYIVRRYVSLQLQDARRSFAFADPFLNFTCGPSADPTLADSEFKSSAHHTVTPLATLNSKVRPFIMLRLATLQFAVARILEKKYWWKILTLTLTPMLEVFQLNQIADVGAPRSKDPTLISREIIFEEFQPMWSRYLNVTLRQTDRQYTTAIPRFALKCIAR